jgi:hypothetical protein
MIKRTVWLLLSVVFSIIQLWSANSNQPIGGRSAGLANTSVTLTDFWSVHNNQAGLGSIIHPAAGVYYENRFLVQEMSLKAVALLLPTKSGTFGINYNSFGFTSYNEMKAGLAYGKKFGKHFSAGVQLDYLRKHIAENYGNQDAFTFEVGIQAQLTEQFSLGAHVFNPIGVKIQSETNDRVPSVFKLGILYSISEKLLIAVETEKNSEFKPLIRGGIEYNITDRTAARIGYSTMPSTSGSDSFSIASVYSFGFGLNLKRIVLDLSSSWHQTLGWSPMVSVIFNFGKIDK